MRTFHVTIEATVTRTLTVRAATEEEAAEAAGVRFSTDTLDREAEGSLSAQETRKVEEVTRWHLSRYNVTREYGGPEEGGWYYDWWTHDEVVATHEGERPDTVPDPEQATYTTPKGNVMVVGRGSVLGHAGDMIYRWEHTPGQYASKRRPRYE